MKDQNYPKEKTFTIQIQHNQKSLPQFYNHRMSQLKNKVSFYEGQIDPLYQENASLKQHFSHLSRSVSVCTEILRKLLPVQNDPAKKLKLDLASLEQIAEMIAQDWLQLQMRIQGQLLQIQGLKNKIGEVQNNCREILLSRDIEMQQKLQSEALIKSSLLSKIQSLENQLKILEHNKQTKIQGLELRLSVQAQKMESRNKQFQTLKYQYKLREVSYDKKIAYLSAQVENKFKQIQEGKSTVRALCDKLMEQKLAEQAEVYEYMLKTKEQEKMALAFSKDESQQLLNKKIQAKESEYQKLAKLNESHRLEIDQLNGKINLMNNQVMAAKKANKQLENQNFQISESNKSLMKQLRVKQEELASQKNKMQQQIAKLEQEQTVIKLTNSKQTQSLQDEYNKLREELIQKQQRISQLEGSQKQFDKMLAQRLEQFTKTWKQTEQKLKNQIKLKQNEIQKQKQALNTIKYAFERKILGINQSNKEMLENMQKKHKRELEEINRQNKNSIKLAKEKLEEQLLANKIQHQKILSSLKNQYETQKQKTSQEYSKKIEQQKKNFLSKQSQLQKRMKIIEQEGQSARQKLLKAESKIKLHDAQMEKLDTEYIKRIKKIEEKNEEEKRQLNERLQKQLKDFQKQLESQISLMCDMKAQMQDNIHSLKESKGILQFQEKSNKEIAQLKLKFNEELKRVEEGHYKRYKDLQESHLKQIDGMKKLHADKLRNLEIIHQSNIDKIHKEIQMDLVKIAEQTENKLTCLNDRLLCGIHTDDLTKVERPALINYIGKGIQSYKLLVNEKQLKIAQLEQIILNKQKEIQLYQKNIEEKANAKREQYQYMKKELLRQMDKCRQSCKAQLAKAQKQKIQYTQKMFEQFQNIKNEHQKKYMALYSKYLQLQKLFNARPRRAEDVTKIKQLMTLKDKMNYEMQTFQKKVQTANEIIRYLNMQLQNYKTTYDMFGPNPTFQNTLNFSPNKTMSLLEEISLTESLKANKLEKIQKIKGQYISLIKQVNQGRRDNDSPLIRQLKVFQQPNSDQSMIMDFKQSEQLRERKFSLISEKESIKKEKLKAQKLYNLQNGQQMITHAQNFIKKAKDGRNGTFMSFQQFEASTSKSKKKTYRKRRLSKKINTQGCEHYF